MSQRLDPHRRGRRTIIPLHLVAYDVNLHHIEVNMPHRCGTLGGYQCR